MSVVVVYFTDADTEECIKLLEMQGTVLEALIEARRRINGAGLHLTPPTQLVAQKAEMPPPDMRARKRYLEAKAAAAMGVKPKEEKIVDAEESLVEVAS